MRKKAQIALGLVSCLTSLVFLGIAASVSASGNSNTPVRPRNILLVIADDLGWSDPGFMGSEITTPSLDALANRGQVFTRAYVAPTCSPTRAMLMTGRDHHRAGIGSMAEILRPNQQGQPGYTGTLAPEVPTLAEHLAGRGYRTLLSGKWHLGSAPDQLPGARGFRRSFALMQGGASHFGDALPMYPGYGPAYLLDDEPVSVPADFYSSRDYTRQLRHFLVEQPADQPFFAVLAFTAPHDPLHAPLPWIARYRDAYRDGPAATFAARVARQKTLGLLPPQAATPWRGPTDWQQRGTWEQASSAGRMQLHAAMISALDAELGELMADLESRGLADNTLVVFLSDNGAAASQIHHYPGSSAAWVERHSDNRLVNLGKPGSRVSLGPDWAGVANAPLWLHKGTLAEGGIRVPLVVAGPGIPSGRQTGLAHATDLLPTLLEWAGWERAQAEALGDGDSWLPRLRGDETGAGDRDGHLGMELFGDRAITRGPWKALQLRGEPGHPWLLFHIEDDPAETRNLACLYPELLNSLQQDWARYADAQGVILPQPPFPSVVRTHELPTCEREAPAPAASTTRSS